jgi:hypothetical protein
MISYHIAEVMGGMYDGSEISWVEMLKDLDQKLRSETGYSIDRQSVFVLEEVRYYFSLLVRCFPGLSSFAKMLEVCVW